MKSARAIDMLHARAMETEWTLRIMLEDLKTQKSAAPTKELPPWAKALPIELRNLPRQEVIKVAALLFTYPTHVYVYAHNMQLHTCVPSCVFRFVEEHT